MEFRVLGPVEVLDGGARIDIGGPLERALLSRLLLELGQTVSIDRLVEDLYPGEPPGTAVNSIRVRISRLRKALPGGEQGPIRTRQPGYVFILGAGDTLDVTRFQQLAEQGRAALRDGDAETAAKVLRKAIALWRGPALADVGDAPFARAEAARLEEGRLAALEQRIDADLALGEHLGLVGELEALCAQHPTRERFWAQRMVALYRSGRQADALAVFQELRRRLTDELGLDPSPELSMLESQILSQSPELEPRPAPPVAPSRPPLADAVVPTAGTFAGRVPELERLASLFKEVSSGGLRAVFVVGEPGIGKTRLCGEFSRIAHQKGAVVLYGRSDEEPLVPYQPFVEALRRWAASLSPPERRGVPGADHLATLIGELAEVANPQSHEDPQVARYKFFEAVASALAHATQAGPTVLVLDDLHWADRPTLQLLQYVLRHGSGSHILVVGTYRETDLSRTRPLAEALADFRRERTFERIALHGLNEEEIFDLLAGAATHEIGGAGRKLVRALSQATDGNPFFIEQIVGHLIDTGRLARREGVWTLDARVEDLGIPEGVVEAIGRRLSRLSEPCNTALAAASVLGREFEVDLLTRVLERDADDVLAAIEEALQVGIIRELPGRVRAICTFSHALVQQVLYEEISLARKQRLHLRAAAAIESEYAADIEPHVRALARHSRAAGAVADPEKAIDYSARAMEAAARVFAFEEAIAHGEAALDLIDEYGAGLAQRGRLDERLGDLWYVAGRPERDRSLSHYESALQRYEENQERTKTAKVQIKLGRIMATDNVDNAKALRYLRSAERTLSSDPDPRLAGPLALNLAVALNTALDPDAAAEASDRGMRIGRALGSDSMWAAGAAIRGGALTLLGRFDEAAELCDQAWHVADRIDNALTGYTAAWMRCVGCRWHPDDHLRLALMELEKPRQHQTQFLRLSLRKLVAIGLAYAGEMTQARDMTDDPSDVIVTPVMMFSAGSFDEMESRVVASLADLRSVGHRWGEGVTTLFLGIIRWAAGSIRPARDTFARAIEIVEGKDLPDECEGRARLAILEAGDGRADEAAKHVARCEEILSRGSGWRGCVGIVELARAAAVAASGRLGDAEQKFIEAINIFRRYGLPFDEAEALLQWGRSLAAGGEPKRALEKYDAALEIYTTCDIGSAWIDRVRAERNRPE